MTRELESYLSEMKPVFCSEDIWGEIRLSVNVYLTELPPPGDLVSNVRCVILKDDHVVTIHTKNGGTHVLPGGRVEPRESLRDALERELLEETRWTIREPKQLGFIHYHHLTPKPEGYRHPYPDFIQLIYLAKANDHQPDLPIEDSLVIASDLVHASRLSKLELTPINRLFLDVALDRI